MPIFSLQAFAKLTVTPIFETLRLQPRFFEPRNLNVNYGSYRFLKVVYVFLMQFHGEHMHLCGVTCTEFLLVL